MTLSTRIGLGLFCRRSFARTCACARRLRSGQDGQGRRHEKGRDVPFVKDAMKKDDGMAKTDGMKHDGMMKDGMKKDDGMKKN